MIRQDILDLFRLKPGKKVRLKDHDTGWAQTAELKELGKDAVKERTKEILDKNLEDLAEAQELLYADDRYSVLIVLQAMDAALKKPNSPYAGRTYARKPRCAARGGPPHLGTNRDSGNLLRPHRPPALAATRSLRHLPESVRRLTGGLASPASSSTPDARWSGGRVTGGSREVVWADTKRGDALSARNAENETMRCRSERNDALSVRS